MQPIVDQRGSAVADPPDTPDSSPTVRAWDGRPAAPAGGTAAKPALAGSLIALRADTPAEIR